MSTERVIVSSSVHSTFIKSIRDQHVKGKRCSVASALGAKRIVSLVEDAISKGASLVVGDDLWPPTKEQVEVGDLPAIILDNVDPDTMDIWREETFGPVAVIAAPSGQATGASEEDEKMIALANDSEYGLAASIYSKDVGRALSIAKRLESGLVRINAGTVADDPTVPFGGVKNTGPGRFNGAEAVRQYTQVSSIGTQIRLCRHMEADLAALCFFGAYRRKPSPFLWLGLISYRFTDRDCCNIKFCMIMGIAPVV